MKEFNILKFLDKISSIFKLYGVDYPVMRKILQLKFTMDERRVPTILMDGKNRESKNSFRSALGMYVLMGVIIGLYMIMPLPIYIKMNVVIGMILFMVMTTMISDFSAVLLDIKEKTILLSKPVDAKTLNAAKIIHIIVYLASITLAISGGTLIIGTIRHGIWFTLVLLLEIVLICGFVILFTALFYYVVITIFNGEKLKDIINYFQIALTICMTIMYQFTGRIFEISEMGFNITPHLWHFMLPSAWFAAPFALLVDNDFNKYYIVLSVAAIIVPIITVTLYIKVVAPHFEKNLQKMNFLDTIVRRNMKKEAFRSLLANIFCRKPLEKVFFKFTLQMLSNERKIKLRIYPSLAFAVIFPFIMLFNILRTGRPFSEEFAEITSGRYYLFLYISVSFLATLFITLSLSENYKGAWIYKAMPIGNPVIVVKAAMKAFLVKYIIPIYLVISLIFMAIFGIKVIPSLVLMFINLIMLMLLVFKESKKELPFCKDFQYTKNANNTFMVLISLFICGAFAGIHYLALRVTPFGLAINIVISAIITSALWHYSFKFSWKELEEETVKYGEKDCEEMLKNCYSQGKED